MCPAKINIPKLIRQIKSGDFLGAYNTIIERAPLPAVLGRVCHAPCNKGCKPDNNESIQIRFLARYVSDALTNLKRTVKRAKLTGKSIAVIGAGPSGIAVAYYLGMLGHNVTVYEKGSKCGGAMLWGIPNFRLPKDILQKEIEARFEEAKVNLVTNTKIKTLEPLLEKGFDAIYVSIGAEKSNKLHIDGENSPGVIDYKELLTSVNVEGKKPNLGNDVIVIGGGNSSIDAARIARRLGVENVTIYHRKTEIQMPSLLREIQTAMMEGVNFDFLSNPIKIIPGERLRLVVQCKVMKEVYKNRKLKIMPIKDRVVIKEVDTIVKAIGSRVEVPVEFGLKLDDKGRINIDYNYMTNLKGIFAGGDAVFGPSSVIEAFKNGWNTASAIDQYLGGKGLLESPPVIIDASSKLGSRLEYYKLKREKIRERSIIERLNDFDEVELGFNEKKARREAERCLSLAMHAILYLR